MHRRTFAACFVIAALGMASSVRAQDCDTSLSAIDAHLKSGDLDAAKDELSGLDPCGASYLRSGQAAIAGAHVKAAARLTYDESRRSEYRSLIETAAGYHVNWEASWRLAELQRRERRYPDAAANFQEAIDLLAAAMPEDPQASGREQLEDAASFLLRSADEMRALAAAPEEGRESEFVAALVDRRDGSFAGVFNPAFNRGLAAEKVPVPITFVYDSARFDDVGRKAAAEMVALFKSRRPSRIEVVGFTDRKGSSEYNLALSARRAEAVKSYLAGELSDASSVDILAEGRGSVGRDLSDPSAYTREQIDQLDRRVEFTWSE